MKVDSYICPSCRSPIPLDDINVPRDLALCRSCGKTSPFSSLCTLDPADDKPPKGVQTESDFLDGSERITCRFISLPFLLIFVPGITIAFGSAIYNIYGTQIAKGVFDPRLSLIGLPMTLFMISIAIWGVFIAVGKTTITLRRGEVSVFTGIGTLGWKRRLPCGPNTKIRIEQSLSTANGRNKNHLAIQNDSDICRFGSLLPQPTLQYILSQIFRQCFPS